MNYPAEQDGSHYHLHSYSVSHFHSTPLASAASGNMKVLGDRDNGLTPEESNPFETEHLDEFRSLACREGIELQAGCLHSNTRDVGMSFFAPHVDKAFVTYAEFLPVAGTFWTVIAVPRSDLTGRELIDHSARYYWWRETLEDTDPEMFGQLEIYEKDFLQYVRRKSNSTEFTLCRYYCKPGARLRFPASRYCHGTIILPNAAGRTLLILHPFVEVDT